MSPLRSPQCCRIEQIWARRDRPPPPLNADVRSIFIPESGRLDRFILGDFGRGAGHHHERFTSHQEGEACGPDRPVSRCSLGHRSGVGVRARRATRVGPLRLTRTVTSRGASHTFSRASREGRFVICDLCFVFSFYLRHFSSASSARCCGLFVLRPLASGSNPSVWAFHNE